TLPGPSCRRNYCVASRYERLVICFQQVWFEDNGLILVDANTLAIWPAVRDYGSISTSTKPVESTSIRSRSVRNGCGFANDFSSNSPNFGTSEVFLPAFLNAST